MAENEKKKARSKWIFDARRRQFHRHFSLKNVGCNRHEKIWTVKWGSSLQEVQSGLVLNPSPSRYELREL